MSANEERVLIHRLAAGELDAVEEEQARALMATRSRVGRAIRSAEGAAGPRAGAFPEPPPLAREPAVRGADAPAHARRWSSRVHRPPRSGRSETRRSAVDALPASVRAARAWRACLFTRAFRRVEPSPGAHLFHLREIRRDDGLSVELEFYAGDVLAVHSEVLLSPPLPAPISRHRAASSAPSQIVRDLVRLGAARGRDEVSGRAAALPGVMSRVRLALGRRAEGSAAAILSRGPARRARCRRRSAPGHAGQRLVDHAAAARDGQSAAEPERRRPRAAVGASTLGPRIRGCARSGSSRSSSSTWPC